MTGDEREKVDATFSPDPLALINRLSILEKQLMGTTFVAPVTRGRQVSVQVDGIQYKMRVSNSNFEGWAVLECTAPVCATICGEASAFQIKAYMQTLPRFRLVLLGEFAYKLWALQASSGDSRVHISAPVQVALAQRPGCFETVCARFDGATFFYESIDRRRDPAVARNLRSALHSDVEPEELHVPESVPQERLAYKMLWLHKHPQYQSGTVKLTQQGRIEHALDHAGATLEKFWNEEDGTIAVKFVVGKETHVARVKGDDLSVVHAGICLSGLDHTFDLTSLVGVMREGGYDYEY